MASSEDEKICLSPTLLESVPEKMEAILPAPTPTELSAAVVAEEPTDGSSPEQTTSAPLDNGDVHQNALGEKPRAEVEDAASPETQAEPTAPVAQMHRLEITAADTREVEVEEEDTGKTLPTEQASSPMSEVSDEKTEDSESPTEEGDQYQHLKVTLTLPEDNKVVPKEENEERPTGKDNVNTNGKKVHDKAKDARMRDSSSGAPATDNRNVDPNLSISSFLSKAKEPVSVSGQVTSTYGSFSLFMPRFNPSLFLFLTPCYQAAKEDIEKDSQIHRGWSGS